MHLFGLMFMVFASVMILGFWALAVCMFLAGRYLERRAHYTFCLVVAGVECLFMPFGTVLGVFTIVMLVRPEVKSDFGIEQSPEASA